MRLLTAQVGYGYTKKRGEEVYWCRVCKSPFFDSRLTPMTSLVRLVDHLALAHQIVRVGTELEVPDELADTFNER